MKTIELENIALEYAKKKLGDDAMIVSVTHAGDLPSIKIVIDGEENSITLWLNTQTGEIEEED